MRVEWKEECLNRSMNNCSVFDSLNCRLASRAIYSLRQLLERNSCSHLSILALNRSVTTRNHPCSTLRSHINQTLTPTGRLQLTRITGWSSALPWHRPCLHRLPSPLMHSLLLCAQTPSRISSFRRQLYDTLSHCTSHERICSLPAVASIWPSGLKQLCNTRVSWAGISTLRTSVG
jgi:hypothetical protein